MHIIKTNIPRTPNIVYSQIISKKQHKELKITEKINPTEELKKKGSCLRKKKNWVKVECKRQGSEKKRKREKKEEEENKGKQKVVE